MKKYALTTLVDDNYMIGTKVLINSFLKYNKWFDEDIVVLDNKLSDNNKEQCISWYKKISFVPVDCSSYPSFPAATSPRLHSAYYTLEALNLKGYNRIVFFDSDILVLGDISYLFNEEFSFGARFLGRRQLNSGVMSISDPYLSSTTYDEAISLIEEYGGRYADQDILSKMFYNVLSRIPVSFNLTKKEFEINKFGLEGSELKTIHYVGQKPWQTLENYAVKGKKRRNRDIECNRGENLWYQHHLEFGGSIIDRLEQFEENK